MQEKNEFYQKMLISQHNNLLISYDSTRHNVNIILGFISIFISFLNIYSSKEIIKLLIIFSSLIFFFKIFNLKYSTVYVTDEESFNKLNVVIEKTLELVKDYHKNVERIFLRYILFIISCLLIDRILRIETNVEISIILIILTIITAVAYLYHKHRKGRHEERIIMDGYVLENKLGISASRELHKEEERITKIKAIELWEKGILDSKDSLSLDTLYFIHKYLFNDIYDFAGKTRTSDISKNGIQFCLLRHIDYMINIINEKICNSVEDVIELYVEVNLLHPFREGNGRATRLWLDNVLKVKFNQVVDWSLISSNDYLNAMVKSPFDDKKLKELLINSLTDKVLDKDLFFRGLDKSYEYEELYEYSAEQLSKDNDIKVSEELEM